MAEHDEVIHVILDRIASFEKTMDKRFDGTDDRLERIEAEVRRTNGRVTTLETKAAAEQAVQNAQEKAESTKTERRRWVPEALTTVIAVVVTLAAEVLFGSHVPHVK